MQSDPDLFPGIKLFFQIGNFFIMDSETLAVNSFQETHQTAISEVLKKNSLTERDTSIKNRVCENHYNMVRTGLDRQRTRQLRQLLDHSCTLRHEATLLHLERQRQAIEVQTSLQPDAHWKYEDIRLRSRERHMGVHLAPCYLDKRQQFPVRLRSTKDNRLTPIVRSARARLRQHRPLEDRQRNNPSTSRSSTPHGAQCTPAPLAAASPRLQQRGPRLAAVSEPASRSRPGISTPTGLADATPFLANPVMTALHNHTNSFHYNRTQSSLNNDTEYPLDHQRNSSVSYYTIHSLDKHPHSSPSNHTSSITNHTSSLPNHTTSSLSNPITLSLDDHTQHKLDSDITPTARHSTNQMSNKMVSSLQEMGKPVGNSHICDADPANSAAGELSFPDDDDDDDDDQNQSEYIDLQAHFYGHHTNKDMHDDFPDIKQTSINQLLCRLRKQCQAPPTLTGTPQSLATDLPDKAPPTLMGTPRSPATDLQDKASPTLMGTPRSPATDLQDKAPPTLTGTPRSPATDLQDKVNAFLKNLPPSENARSTIKVCDAQLISPTTPQTPNSRNMNKSTANNDRHDLARVTSELKSPTTPSLIHQNTAAMMDSCTPTEDTDQNRAEIKASNTNYTPPRRSQYSWRDIQVPPRREGHAGAYTAEDLVLQALTGIPIRNVFQTPVPLHTASRAMRRTATFKMHQIVERMIKERTRYERHQVEQLKRQMTLELKGQAIAEEELVQQVAGDNQLGNIS